MTSRSIAPHQSGTPEVFDWAATCPEYAPAEDSRSVVYRRASQLAAGRAVTR